MTQQGSTKKIGIMKPLMAVMTLITMMSPMAYAAESDVTVTIVKYVEGAPATAASAASAGFPMNAAWSAANIGTGSGQYVLGQNNDPVPYQAMTVAMSAGANYSTDEDLSGTAVGASCAESKPFALVGYTTGNTLAEAASSTPSMALPAFTGLTGNKFVIVWNHDCAILVHPVPVTVTVSKYIDGMQASSSTAADADFPMHEASSNGSSDYVLSAGNLTPYQATSGGFDPESDIAYSTNEIVTGPTVGASCSEGKPFALVGYTTGGSMAEAAAGTPTSTAPAFANSSSNFGSDKFVIVWNHDCSNLEGDLNGDVTGGMAPHGALAVTSVDALDTSATADGTFANGWKYAFNVTIPDNETGVAMKFADWTNSSASSTLAAAGNMRISSAQANNAGATIMLLAANVYSAPDLVITGDLDPILTGKQIRILVEVAVPATTVNGSYATSYGIRTR